MVKLGNIVFAEKRKNKFTEKMKGSNKSIEGSAVGIRLSGLIWLEKV